MALDSDWSKTHTDPNEQWVCRSCRVMLYDSLPPSECPACGTTRKEYGSRDGTRVFERVDK